MPRQKKKSKYHVTDKSEHFEHLIWNWQDVSLSILYTVAKMSLPIRVQNVVTDKRRLILRCNYITEP